MKKKTIIGFIVLFIATLLLTFIYNKSLELPQDLPLSIEVVHNDKVMKVNLTQIYHKQKFKKAKVWTTDNNHKLEKLLVYLNKTSIAIKQDLDSKVIIAPMETSNYSEINLYNIKENYLTLNNSGLINLDLAEKMFSKMEIMTEQDMIYIIEIVTEKSILGISLSKVKSYYMFLVK